MRLSFLKKTPTAPSTSQSSTGIPLDARKLYRVMLTARLLDEMESKLVARGEAFFNLPGSGHEGTAVLNAFLKPEDYLHLHYRDKALMLARGVRPLQFFHNLLCNAESHSSGRQMCPFFSDPARRIIPMVTLVGNSALQSAGVATVLKTQGKGDIAVCSMGDGTTQQGEVLEAIAEAVRSRLPVLFLIEDNRYAISTRTQRNTFYSLPDGEPAQFYGLPIHRLDGRDPIALHGKLGSIFEALRRHTGPALVVLQVERLSSHTNADDESRYRGPEEIRKAAEFGDPIKNLARHLLSNGMSNLDLQATEQEIRVDLEVASEEALNTWSAPPATDAKRPLPPSLTKISAEPDSLNGEGQLTMLEAMRGVLRRRLAMDERVTLLGEDIEDPKGDVFGVTRGLTKDFPGRVTNSALSESTIVGVSIGRALAGGRPVAMIQFADFLPLAFNQILCELGTIYWRSAGGWECPVIIMAPCGGFRPGLGPFHAQTMESVLAHAPGLDVFMPSNATDAAGLLNAAFESNRPTVFLYPKICLNDRENLAPQSATERLTPIGKARFLSHGTDLTLVTWGATVPICVKVVNVLRSARVSVDLIDLRSISPWDREAVCESAERTGTLVVVHEDNLTAGFGAEVVAAVTETVPKKIAVRRVTRPDTYIPCRFANQLEILPSFKRVLAAVSEFLDLELGWTSGEGSNGDSEFVKALGSSPADKTVTIVAWKIKTGDTVAAGDIIADVESDKAIAELACPTSGTVEEILVAPGKSVPVGTPILRVRPERPGERLTPTIVLQRGEPVVKRKEKRTPAPASDKATAPQTRSARSVIGMSGISTAEGSITVSNETLAARFPNRTAGEIFQLTGIETRRHLAENETALDLAATAASNVLKAEGLTVSDLDAILVSTTTPVEVTPSMACALQARLCPNGEPTQLVAYDILAACSGFLYALSAAFNLLQTRPTAKVMVVTAEALSKVVNRDNFDTAILFGDAATAVILYGPANLHRAKMLVHAPVVAAKPDPDRILRVSNPGSGFVEMQGKKVFGESVRTMLGALDEACVQSGLKLEDLNMIIPHQANGRIIEAVRSRLGVSGDRVVNQVRQRGNTSSCTIPLCLADLDGKLVTGNRLGLCAFGGGFTFGSAILEINGQKANPAEKPSSRPVKFTISAEAAIANTVVVDVTDNAELLDRARWLTAEGYVALADPKFAIGLEDVFNVVSSDVYEEAGRSRTFVTLTTDPETGSVRVSGTVRVVLGKESEHDSEPPPIDAIHFVEPINGWPHKQNRWTESEISELGRFFIPARYRSLAMRRAGVDAWITSLLYKAAQDVVRKNRMKIFYAIMPPYVTRLLDRAGIRMELIDSRLKTDNPAVAHVFEQFSLYWQRSHPKLYHFADAPVIT